MIHTKTTTGGVITYDSADWRAGLAPQGIFTTNPFIKYVGVNGFANTSRIDPFQKYGTLSPGKAPSANATNNAQLTSAISALELTDNSTSLGVDVGGKIHQINTGATTPVISTTSPFPHTITGTSPVGQDGILYRHNYNSASVVSFFYSYYNNANWNIGAYEVVAGTFDGTDDFMSVRPATPLDITSGDGDDTTQRTAPHPMEIGADGILYIGSGRYLHAYDGNTGSTYGTFYSKVLTLPQGTQIVAIKKFKDIFLIACNYYSNGTATSGGASGTGKALLYTWDYTSLDITDVTDLEDFYVSALFIWKGSPTVITSGTVERNGKNKVKVISGNSVDKVADYDGTIPNNRGIVVLNEVIYTNSGGQIITIGDRFKKDTYPVNHISDFSGVGYSGVLAYNEIMTCFMGSSATSAGTTPVFNNINNGLASGSCRVPLYYPDFPTGKIGRIKYVYVEYYKPLTAGGTNGNFSLVLNTDLGSGSYTLIANKSSVTIPLINRISRTTSNLIINANNASFTCFDLLMSWVASTNGDSPTISSISVEYELLEVTN